MGRNVVEIEKVVPFTLEWLKLKVELTSIDQRNMFFRYIIVVIILSLNKEEIEG